MDDVERLTETSTILKTAIPAILYSVVPPTVVAAELAALGHVRGGGPPAQAAFAATGAAVSFLVSSANFLVNGVSAQVGAAAASGHWRSLRGRVRVALGAGALVGVAWGLALAVSLDVVVDGIFSLQRDAARAARPFLSLRSATLPFLLTNSAIAGTLQGYGRVGTSAALASFAAATEAAAVAFLLLKQQNAAGGSKATRFVPPLELVGRASLFSTAAACLAGLALVQLTAPERSRDPLGLSRVFGRKRARATDAEARERATSTSLSSSPRFLLAPGTTVAPDEETHGGTDLDAMPLVPEPSPSLGRDGGEEEEPPLSLGRLVSELAAGGFFLFGRSTILQVTFVTGVAVASRRGTSALAAHGIVAQLWMTVAFCVDGLETAACVLGSRLAAAAKGASDGGGGGSGSGNRTNADNASANRAKRAFATLSKRLLSAGAAIGLSYSVAMALFRGQISRLFTGDEGALDFLLRGPAWPILMSAQVLNALVFVLDGLVYSVRDFRGAFFVMLSSFVLLFAPVLAVFAGLLYGTQVWPIWLAKTAQNVGRLTGLLWVLRREYRRW